MTGSLLTLVFALIAGCAVGPDFRKPAAPEAKGYTATPLPKETTSAAVAGGGAQRFVHGLDIPGQWWRLFHSKPLDALIAEALRANPSLTAAKAALRQAHEAVLAGRGAFFPTVGAGFSAERNKTSGSLGADPANDALYYSLYTPQLTVSYVPDVFGGTRRTVEALTAAEEAQRFQLEAAYLSLTSNLVAAVVSEAALRGQIAATRRIIAIQRRSLDILRRQQALGETAGADVAAQRAALAQAQASLPPLQKQLAQQRNLLSALLGRLPSREPSAKFKLTSLHLPEKLPVSLPSHLVEQRPDIRAAQAELHAASAEIGVAIAHRLPQITLSADVGRSALALGDLFSPGNGIWSLAGDLTEPIFDGGSLLHQQRAAEAAYQAALAQYKATVQAGFQNVADALRALQSDAEALRTAVAAENAAKQSLDIARRQLALGAIGYLGLLTAQQAYQEAESNLVEARANRFADTAALFEALGGGWWNRNDVASPQAIAAAAPGR